MNISADTLIEMNNFDPKLEVNHLILLLWNEIKKTNNINRLNIEIILQLLKKLQKTFHRIYTELGQEGFFEPLDMWSLYKLVSIKAYVDESEYLSSLYSSCNFDYYVDWNRLYEIIDDDEHFESNW